VGTGLERLGALQQQYIRVCENQVMPPVPPDLAVLEGLSHKRLSTDLDNSSKEALRALALFLDSEEARHKLQCVCLKAGESAKSARKRNSDGGSMMEKHAAGVRKLMAALGRLLSGSKALLELSLHGVPLTAADLKHISHGIERSSSLAVLALRECSINDVTFRELCKPLSIARVVSLDLSGNRLSDDAGGVSVSLGGDVMFRLSDSRPCVQVVSWRG
jgi:hypothetical protein